MFAFLRGPKRPAQKVSCSRHESRSSCLSRGIKNLFIVQRELAESCFHGSCLEVMMRFVNEQASDAGRPLISWPIHQLFCNFTLRRVN